MKEYMLQANNLKILNKLDQEFVHEVYLILEHLEGDVDSTQLSLANKKQGEEQTIEFFMDEMLEEHVMKKIKKVYVNQTTNGGCMGDDFEGDVFIPISKNNYLKIPYSY